MSDDDFESDFLQEDSFLQEELALLNDHEAASSSPEFSSVMAPHATPEDTLQHSTAPGAQWQHSDVMGTAAVTKDDPFLDDHDMFLGEEPEKNVWSTSAVAPQHPTATAPPAPALDIPLYTETFPEDDPFLDFYKADDAQHESPESFLAPSFPSTTASPPQAPLPVPNPSQVQGVASEDPFNVLLPYLQLEKAVQLSHQLHDDTTHDAAAGVNGKEAAAQRCTAPTLRGVPPRMTPPLLRFFLPNLPRVNVRPVTVAVIAQAVLNVGVDLPALSCALRTVEYNPMYRIPTAVLRLHHPRAVVVVRSSGMMTILGAKSVSESRQAAELAARIIRKALHLDFATIQFRVRSITARFNVCSPVRLDAMAQHRFVRSLSAGGVSFVSAHFEPERFAGCILRLTGESTTSKPISAPPSVLAQEDPFGFQSPPPAETVGPSGCGMKRARDEEWTGEGAGPDTSQGHHTVLPPPAVAAAQHNRWCVTCLIYVNGKITFLGARSEEELRFAFDAVVPIVSQYLGGVAEGSGVASPNTPRDPVWAFVARTIASIQSDAKEGLATGTGPLPSSSSQKSLNVQGSHPVCCGAPPPPALLDQVLKHLRKEWKRYRVSHTNATTSSPSTVKQDTSTAWPTNGLGRELEVYSDEEVEEADVLDRLHAAGGSHRLGADLAEDTAEEPFEDEDLDDYLPTDEIGGD